MFIKFLPVLDAPTEIYHNGIDFSSFPLEHLYSQVMDHTSMRHYPIQLETLPKLEYNDPLIDEYLSAGKPIVIVGSDLVSSASAWDLDYFEARMFGKYTVVVSDDHNFMYYDDQKLDAHPDVIPSTKRLRMTMSDFATRVRNWKENDERIYLQQPLDSSVGSSIVQDFARFNWRWITEKQRKNNWGPLSANLLMISTEGNVTPCHYDEQENFFAQIRGYKRIILFGPSKFKCLYPHPVHHPYDRQSQVNFENPDYERFPNFKDIKGYETVVGPSDVLYIPAYWFHHVESLPKNQYTISLNFWYKTAPTGRIIYPLKDAQKLAVMRNVEKMLVKALGGPEEVGPLLKTIVDGRYPD